MAKKRVYFPTFWTIILLLAIAWLLKEMGYLNVDIPWLPTILIVIAIGAIVNHYGKLRE